MIERIKAHYYEWQISRRLPLWAYVVIMIYFALCGFGLTKEVIL